MLSDRRIPVGYALSAGAWIATAVALLMVWITEDVRVGFTTVVVLGVAACLTCREIVVGHRDRLWNAFMLGQDSAASRGNMAPLRRL